MKHKDSMPNGETGESPYHGKKFTSLPYGDGSEGCHQHGGHDYYDGQGGKGGKGKSTADPY
jgi:hypothetical protein